MDLISQNQFLAALVLPAIGIVVSLAALWLAVDAGKKASFLLGGKKIKSEAEFLKNIVVRTARTEAKLEELEPRLEIVEKNSQIAVQKVGFLRFNPFQDTGGDQSFIIVLLDRENCGLILSSLYTREGVRVYAKAVDRGEPKHGLSEEEKKVLEQTLQKS